jgi:molecular chaperone GrpE (heat shock protein)
MLERLNEYEINGLKVDIKRIKLKYNFALPKVDLLLHEFNIDKKELVQQFSAQAVACIDKAVTLFNKNRNDNYNVIREEKLRAEAWRKNTIDLIRHYILPPIDGIERGMADGKEFIKKIPKSYIKYDKTIKRWLGVIALAYNRIKKSLSNAGIDLIEPGNDFNPEIHFPISTEESPDLPDGKILCVIRNGFIYKGIQVRPVEVVVVKNKKSFKEGDSGG